MVECEWMWRELDAHPTGREAITNEKNPKRIRMLGGANGFIPWSGDPFVVGYWDLSRKKKKICGSVPWFRFGSE